MSGHTPEPLEAVGNFVRTSMAQPAGKSRGVLVAECRDADGFAHSDEANANARLFAAAPDLLEALRPIAKYGEISAEIIDAARAAIAKTTGK